LSAHSILIVDDNQRLPEVLTRNLRERNYQVSACHSIEEALAEIRRGEPPTFILADRMLDEPIEVRNLARLCDAAPQSKVLVYTAQELTQDEHRSILNRGAYRVLDKSAVNKLSDDIDLLIGEFEELLELSGQLADATRERSRIVAALIGTGVAVSVVDRSFHRWFQFGSEGAVGGICRSQCPSTRSPAAFPFCRGCTVADVLRTKQRVDRLLLQQFQDGTLGWATVQSTPILSKTDGSIVAVREAVDRAEESTLAGLSLQARSQHIAEALVAAGFGRARIYQAQSSDQLRLLAAAATTDGTDVSRTTYFDNLGDVTMNISNCAYSVRAKAAGLGALTLEWDLPGGASSYTSSLGLELPYLDIPVWRASGQLDGWIAVDFAGLREPVRIESIGRLATDETLEFLSEAYGREVVLAIEASASRGGDRRKFEIVQRAKLGFAAATSVDHAITCIREAFEALLPGCRVSVRSRRGNTLREFQSLCCGEPSADTDSGSPSEIALDDPRSLAASVVHTQRALWISDYEDYVSLAEADGEPLGYSPAGTRSTAQIPLRFESTAFGTLSINSPETIQWANDGYKMALFALAENTALVLRDLALHEERDRAMADRAAIVAYSVRASGDALWRHWTQQRLAEASALLALARKRGGTAIDPTIVQLIVQVSDLLTSIHASRPNTAVVPNCTIDAVFSRLRGTYAQRDFETVFASTETRLLKMPEPLLRGVLTVLIDNALTALHGSPPASSARVTARAQDNMCVIDVVDDGPGIPDSLRQSILGAPVQSRTGQGVGLLYARGAALQYEGDLVLIHSRRGAHFQLTVPTDC
jgi:CheY-like chemotaxis protein